MNNPLQFGALVLGLAAGSLSSAADPLRLDPRVAPVTQALELTLDPAREGYSGVARVELMFEVSTNLFRFHAEEIDLGPGTIDGQPVTFTPGEAGLVIARAREPIPAGLRRFEVSFTNNYNRDGSGIYKTVAGGDAYLFTQMEPVDARRSFPCWDEPAFKIPWRMTMIVPEHLEAIGNMPVAASRVENGSKVLEFGRTPPMPSYLVALAVGPLDWIEIPGHAVPGRIYTARGQTNLAHAAARDATPILAELERYFGLPYPYPKLDHIGVPEFRAGAMENVGLITYRDSILLFDEAKGSYQQARALSSIVAHEIAHMWFGNLVTMAWWDDLWLNESFATWMSYKAAGRVRPEQRMEFRGFETAWTARRADSKPSVKPIRRPFTAGDNLEEAFDVLSYNKGQGILRMVEGWLGEEKFRQALRRYFVRHAWGNARAEDLWAAFADSGERTLSETLRGFIEQPGLPHLIFRKLPGNRLEVRQQRYRTITGENITPQFWQVPVVLRHGGPSWEGTTRVLLTRESEVLQLPAGEEIEWVHPNAGENGYYTWSLPADLSAALGGPARGKLGGIERLGVLAAAEFSMQSGEFPASEYLQLLLGFAGDPDPEVKEQVIQSLVAFGQIFAGAADTENFERLLGRVARPMLEEIGREPRAGEAPHLAPLRATLLVALGTRANDPGVIEYCRELAVRQLSAPREVSAGIAGAALQVASWHGDRAWLERVQEAFVSAKGPDIRGRFRSALTSFRDPEIMRAALEYLLTDAVRSNEVLPRRSVRMEPEHAGVIFDWVVDHYAALARKVGESTMPSLARFLEEGDEALLARGRFFFLDASRVTPLTEVHFRKAAEGVELRAALRERYGGEVSAWLSARERN